MFGLLEVMMRGILPPKSLDEHPTPSLRQTKRHIGVTGLRPQLTAACRDDDKLSAAHCKRAGRGVAGRGEHRLPQHAARALVERAKLRILCRRDEYETAARDDRSAVLLSSSDGNPTRCERSELAERNPPAEFARVEIDRAERTPRWLHGREAARVSPALVTSEFVRRGRR